MIEDTIKQIDAIYGAKPNAKRAALLRQALERWLSCEMDQAVFQWCRKGGEARRDLLTPRQRKMMARKAAKARWAKHKKKEKK